MTTRSLATFIIAGINISISIIGPVFNGLTCFICMRKRLRQTPTFVFIAFNAFIETIPLFIRNLDHAVTIYSQFLFRNRDEIYCKINLFLHYFPLQSSAWLLVAMCLERYLSIKITIWRKSLFNSKHAAIVSAVLLAFFFVVNFCLNFSPNLIKKYSNGTQIESECDDGLFAPIWSVVNLYVYSIVPFGILFIFNCLFVYEVLIKKQGNIERSDKDKAKRRSISISIMALTIKYIVMTGPGAIIGGYFINTIILIPDGPLIWFLIIYGFSTLRFMNHCVGFFVLLATNTMFMKEFKSLFFGIKKNKNLAELASKSAQKTAITNS